MLVTEWEHHVSCGQRCGGCYQRWCGLIWEIQYATRKCVFENKNDSTYLFTKVENIVQKDSFLFTFNSRYVWKHSDQLQKRAQTGYPSS